MYTLKEPTTVTFYFATLERSPIESCDPVKFGEECNPTKDYREHRGHLALWLELLTAVVSAEVPDGHGERSCVQLHFK